MGLLLFSISWDGAFVILCILRWGYCYYFDRAEKTSSAPDLPPPPRPPLPHLPSLITRRLTHTQTQSHSDSLITQTHSYSDTLILTQTHSCSHRLSHITSALRLTHSDSFIFRLTHIQTHSSNHSRTQNVRMSQARRWFRHSQGGGRPG